MKNELLILEMENQIPENHISIKNYIIGKLRDEQ